MTGDRTPGQPSMNTAATPEAYDRWAHYYDIGEGDRRPHLDFYASLLRPEDRSVLAIGCGTGVIAAGLGDRISAAGQVPRVVGIDVSANMLAIARTRYPAYEWVQADMREPRVSGDFDLQFCCFNTYQFMRDDQDLARAFAAAREHAAPGGRLTFDIYQPNLPYLRMARRDSLARTVVHGGRQLQIREDARYDEATRVLELEWRLVAADAPGEVLAATSFILRQYFADEIERLLERSGWRMLERYGDLQRAAFTETSIKQVLVCKPA